MPNQKTSSIPNVKAAIVNRGGSGAFQTLLATAGEHPNGGPIQVTYGDQGTGYEDECVVVGDTVAPADQRWRALGGAEREEVYDLAVDIIVVRDTDQQTATERAFVVLGLLETGLRAAWSGTGTKFGLASSFKSITCEVATPHLNEAPLDGGYLAHIEWAVRVTARI